MKKRELLCAEQDFTEAEKKILRDNIGACAADDVAQSDWTETDTDKSSYIKNVPDTLKNTPLTIEFSDSQFSNETSGTTMTISIAAQESNGNFLKDDGTWAKPEGKEYTAGTGIDISDAGEISVVEKGIEFSSDFTTTASESGDITLGLNGGLLSADDRTKLDGFKSNVRANWTQTDTEADDYIVNIPEHVQEEPVDIQFSSSQFKVTDTDSTMSVSIEAGTKTGKFLKDDGTWDTPADTTYSNGTGLTLTGTTFAVDSSKYYDKDEIDGKLSAHAVFCTALPETGDPSKVYYVGPTGSGDDKYDVYVWKVEGETGEFVQVDESSISLEGYWNGDVTDTGTGAFLTGISVSDSGAVSVTRGGYSAGSNIDISDTNEISIKDTKNLAIDDTTMTMTADATDPNTTVLSVKEMVGATESADGSTGLVPAPTAAQKDCVLTGAGWANPVQADWNAEEGSPSEILNVPDAMRGETTKLEFDSNSFDLDDSEEGTVTVKLTQSALSWLNLLNTKPDDGCYMLQTLDGVPYWVKNTPNYYTIGFNPTAMTYTYTTVSGTTASAKCVQLDDNVVVTYEFIERISSSDRLYHYIYNGITYYRCVNEYNMFLINTPLPTGWNVSLLGHYEDLPSNLIKDAGLIKYTNDEYSTGLVDDGWIIVPLMDANPYTTGFGTILEGVAIYNESILGSSWVHGTLSMDGNQMKITVDSTGMTIGPCDNFYFPLLLMLESKYIPS